MVRDREHESGRDVTRIGDVLFGADVTVAQWVAARIPSYQYNPASTAIGVLKDDDLVAGVIYENFNGAHVECSIAAEPGSGWATRETLFHLFDYPFSAMGCEAISICVASTNLQSLKLVTQMGFEPEAMIKFAAHDCSTLIVMKMFRDQCRWIKSHGQERRQRTSSPEPGKDGPGGGAV